VQATTAVENQPCRLKQEEWMKTLVAIVFISGVGLAGVGPAQAMPVSPLGKAATATEMVWSVAKACSRGYLLTPKGCRKKTSR
jgi:hypothetical protein